MAYREYEKLPPPTKEEIAENRTEGLERAWIDLTLGARKPQNKSEERLLKQIKKGLSEGAIFEIPLG